jgi:hypothetical protein
MQNVPLTPLLPIATPTFPKSHMMMGRSPFIPAQGGLSNPFPSLMSPMIPFTSQTPKLGSFLTPKLGSFVASASVYSNSYSSSETLLPPPHHDTKLELDPALMNLSFPITMPSLAEPTSVKVEPNTVPSAPATPEAAMSNLSSAPQSTYMNPMGNPIFFAPLGNASLSATASSSCHPTVSATFQNPTLSGLSVPLQNPAQAASSSVGNPPSGQGVFEDWVRSAVLNASESKFYRPPPSQYPPGPQAYYEPPPQTNPVQRPPIEKKGCLKLSDQNLDLGRIGYFNEQEYYICMDEFPASWRPPTCFVHPPIPTSESSSGKKDSSSSDKTTVSEESKDVSSKPKLKLKQNNKKKRKQQYDSDSTDTDEEVEEEDLYEEDENDDE